MLLQNRNDPDSYAPNPPLSELLKTYPESWAHSLNLIEKTMPRTLVFDLFEDCQSVMELGDACCLPQFRNKGMMAGLGVVVRKVRVKFQYINSNINCLGKLTGRKCLMLYSFFSIESLFDLILIIHIYIYYATY